METKASGHCGPCPEGATILTAATSSGPACGSRLAQKVPDVGCRKGQCRQASGQAIRFYSQSYKLIWTWFRFRDGPSVIFL